MYDKRKLSQKERLMQTALYTGLILFCVFVPVSLIRAMILQKRYYCHLRQNHPEIWEETTTVLGTGPGMQNSYRGLKFLLSRDDTDDVKLHALKASVRNAFVCFLAGSTAIFIVLAIIIKLSNLK